MFTEGSPHNQMIRISEFINEYHMIANHDQNPLPWFQGNLGTAHDALEDAFFNVCVATQGAIIRGISSLRIYDHYPKKRIVEFITRARGDPQAPYISTLLDKLEVANESLP